MTTKALQTYFFDASALVKLLIQEPGSSRATQLLREAPPAHTSWILIAEALNVLKRKWLKGDLADGKYTAAVYLLQSRIRDRSVFPVDLIVDSSGRPALVTYSAAIYATRRKHPKLDAADAVQLVAIKGSFLGNFAGESKTKLVSADAGLIAAAEIEGIQAVDVSK